MGVIGQVVFSIRTLWSIRKWLLEQKRHMEADTDTYLSDERALAWRLAAEKTFKALEEGNGNLEQLPKIVQWFFGQTTVENRIGKFGQTLLKSAKIERDDPVLCTPIVYNAQ